MKQTESYLKERQLSDIPSDMCSRSKSRAWYKSLIPRMESALGYSTDQQKLKSNFNNYFNTPAINLRRSTSLSNHDLYASIWNQPTDIPGTLRIGTLKIIDCEVKELTEDEIIQNIHYYSKKKQQCVERIFENSELKSFKFPRKTSNQEENPHNLKKGDSNIIITQLVNNFNKQSKSIKVIKRNREINTLSSERMSKVIRPNKFNIALHTQNISYFSNNITTERLKDRESKSRIKNQSTDLELESINTDFDYPEKYIDLRTSPNKNNQFIDPFEEYHNTEVISTANNPRKIEELKLNIVLSRNASREKIKTYEIPHSFRNSKVIHTRTKSNINCEVKSIKKPNNKKVESYIQIEKNGRHSKKPSAKITSTNENITNASSSTKDSNLSGIKTSQKKEDVVKGNKKNTYIPIKLKTQSLEEKLTQLLYNDNGSSNQANHCSQNIKLFSKLKTVGIDRNKLQKTLKLYK